MPEVDRTGRRYGRLVVVGKTTERRGNHIVWACRCDCGLVILAAGGVLTSGKVQSCGCLAKEHLDRMHLDNRTHGLHDSPEYFIWQQMKYSCTTPTNSKYHRVGARGITVCDRWVESFENFLADMGPRPSPKHRFVRINRAGNFEPDNVRWKAPVS